MDSEQIQLVLKVVGREDLVKLNEAVAANQKTIVSANDALRAGQITQTQWTRYVGAASAEVVRLNAEMAKISKSTRDYGQNITGLSYAFNDFFGAGGGWGQKLTSVANNLPMLLAGFGGIGLALSAIVPVIGMVITNWDVLMKAFGAGAEGAGARVDVLKKRIEELEAKPHRIAVDVLELENAHREVKAIEAALAAVEKLRTGQSTSERESGKAVGELLGEGTTDDAGKRAGGADVVARARAQFVKEFAAADKGVAEARDKQAKLRETLAGIKKELATGQNDLEQIMALNAQVETVTAEIEAAQAEAAAKVTAVGPKADEAFGGILTGAQAGAGAGQAQAQAQLAKLLGLVGFSGLGAKVAGSTPEDMRTRALTEQGEKGEEEALKEVEKMAKEKADARKAKRKRWAKDDAANEAFRQEAEFDAPDPFAARSAKAAAAKRAKDARDLAAGLGPQFLADAEAARRSTEQDPDLSRGEKARARRELDQQIRNQARARFRNAGADVTRSAELAQQAPAFVDEGLKAATRGSLDVSAANAATQAAHLAATASLFGQVNAIKRQQDQNAVKARSLGKRSPP